MLKRSHPLAIIRQPHFLFHMLEVKPKGFEVKPWNWFRRFSGLLWCEWYAHSRLILTFLIFWLVGMWILSMMANAVWIIILGVIYSYFAGVLFGGSDVIQGIEEFSLSLPPTKAQRYVARLIVGGGSVVVINTMSLISLGTDLPQILAGVAIQSGIADNALRMNLFPFYGLLYGIPIVSFSMCFVLSILGRSRMIVMVSWVWAALVAIFLLHFGIFYEEKYFGKFHGRVAVPLLLVVSLSILVLGYRFYNTKQPGESGPPIAMPNRWWLWVVLMALGVLSSTLAISSILERYKAILSDG